MDVKHTGITLHSKTCPPYLLDSIKIRYPNYKRRWTMSNNLLTMETKDKTQAGLKTQKMCRHKFSSAACRLFCQQKLLFLLPPQAPCGPFILVRSLTLTISHRLAHYALDTFATRTHMLALFISDADCTAHNGSTHSCVLVTFNISNKQGEKSNEKLLLFFKFYPIKTACDPSSSMVRFPFKYYCTVRPVDCYY